MSPTLLKSSYPSPPQHYLTTINITVPLVCTFQLTAAFKTAPTDIEILGRSRLTFSDTYLDIKANIDEDFTSTTFYKASKYANLLRFVVAPGDALSEMDTNGARHIILIKALGSTLNFEHISTPSNRPVCQWFTRTLGELTYRIDVSSDYTTFVERDITPILVTMDKNIEDVIVSIQLPYITQIPVDVDFLELHCFFYCTGTDGSLPADTIYLDQNGQVTDTYVTPFTSYDPEAEMALPNGPGFSPVTPTIDPNGNFIVKAFMTRAMFPNTWLEIKLTKVGLDYDIASVMCDVEYSGDPLYQSPVKIEWELVNSNTRYFYDLVITLYPEPVSGSLFLTTPHYITCAVSWVQNDKRAGYTPFQAGEIPTAPPIISRSMDVIMSSGFGEKQNISYSYPLPQTLSMIPDPPQPTIIQTRQPMSFQFKPNGNKIENISKFPAGTTIQVIAYFQPDDGCYLTGLCETFPVILGNFVFTNGISNYSFDTPTVIPFGRPERYEFVPTNIDWDINNPQPFSFDSSFIISTPDYFFIPDCVDPTTFDIATSGSRQCTSGTCSLPAGTCSCGTHPSAAVFFGDSLNPSCPQPTDPCPETACLDGPAIRDTETGICHCDCQADTIVSNLCPTVGVGSESKVRQLFPTSTFQQSGWDQRWQPSPPQPVLALNFGTFFHFFDAKYDKAEFLVIKLDAKISTIPDSSDLFDGITDEDMPGIIGSIVRYQQQQQQQQQQQSSPSSINHEWQLNYSPQTGSRIALGKITLPYSQTATSSRLYNLSFYTNQFGLDQAKGNYFIVSNPWYKFNQAQWTYPYDIFTEIRLHLFFDPSIANWGGNSPTLSLERANVLVQNLQVDLQFFGRDAVYYKKSLKTQSRYTFASTNFVGFLPDPISPKFNIQVFQTLSYSDFTPDEYPTSNSNGLTIFFDFYLTTTPLPQEQLRLETIINPGALWRMGNFACTVRPDRQNDSIPFVQRPSTQSNLSAAEVGSVFFPYVPWEEYGYPSDSQTLYSCVHDWYFKGDPSEWESIAGTSRINMFLDQVLGPAPTDVLTYSFAGNDLFQITRSQIQPYAIHSTPIVSNHFNKPNTEPSTVIYFAINSPLAPPADSYRPDGTVQITAVGWPDHYTIGYASREGDGFLTLTVSTTSLPSLSSINTFFAVTNSDNYLRTKLRPVNLNSPAIFSYCEAISFDQYGETQASTIGICADDIECSFELCDCPGGALGPGDLCDGKYVEETCMDGTVCPNDPNTFWVPGIASCTLCSCLNNVSCPVDQTFYPDLCSCICDSTCPNNKFKQNLDDCSCGCSLESCPSGPTPILNTDTCSCEPCSLTCNPDQTLDPDTCTCINQCSSTTCSPNLTLDYNDCSCTCTKTCGNDQTLDTNTCSCNDNTPPCTPTNCEYNTQYDCQRASCNCDLNPFLVGSRCQTCSIRCNNNGLANNSCTQCNCSKDGITGQFCQCRSIRFTITFGSVPSFILDAFIVNPSDAGSSETALDYIRTQLLNQRGADLELFSNLKIDSLVLDPSDPAATGPKTLRITGNLRDNCATALIDANYKEVSSKWTTFLNSLIVIVIDDVEIPITDVQIALPDVKCDGILEPGCNEMNHGSSNNQSLLLLSSLVILFTVWISYSF